MAIGRRAFWRVRPRTKWADIPPDAREAFRSPDGTPYKAWKQIEAGNWQPRAAFLEGRFWRIRWRGWDAEREEMGPGSWLMEDESYGISLLSAAEFEAMAVEPAP